MMQLDKLLIYLVVSGFIAATIVYLLFQISRPLRIKRDVIRGYSRYIFSFTLILVIALILLLEVELTYLFFWVKEEVFLTIGLIDAISIIVIFLFLLIWLGVRLRHKTVVIKEKIRVRDVFDSTKMNSLIIDENETLDNTIKRFAEQPQLRGIFLVDERGRLKGVVTRTDLLDVFKLKLGKNVGELPSRILSLKRIPDVKTKVITGMFSHRAYVRLNDPLERALELMIDTDLIDIPVIDDKNNIVGDLKLSKILLKLLPLSED